MSWLEDLRGERTQKFVADAAGITQQAYSAIECGKRRPSVAVAKRIAAVLGFEWVRVFE